MITIVRTCIMNSKPAFYVAAVIFSLTVFAQITAADEPGWYPFTIARGTDRVIIENTPILERPYRPLHFYGNTVRRSHYRGNPMVMPKDVVRATTVRVTRLRRR
jgi:hypothetical protein